MDESNESDNEYFDNKSYTSQEETREPFDFLISSPGYIPRSNIEKVYEDPHNPYTLEDVPMIDNFDYTAYDPMDDLPD